MPIRTKNTKTWVLSKLQIKTLLEASPFSIVFPGTISASDLIITVQDPSVKRDRFIISYIRETVVGSTTRQNKTSLLIPRGEFITALNTGGTFIPIGASFSVGLDSSKNVI